MIPLIGVLFLMTHRQNELENFWTAACVFRGDDRPILSRDRVRRLIRRPTMVGRRRADKPVTSVFYGQFDTTCTAMVSNDSFILKTPIPFLIVILMGLGLALRRQYPKPDTALYWWLFPVFFI